MIKSQLNPRSEEFRANAERMRGLVADLKEKTDRVAMGGDEKAREKHLARGVFGSPYFVVDGEPFWGIDRFDQLERWLKGPF